MPHLEALSTYESLLSIPDLSIKCQLWQLFWETKRPSYVCPKCGKRINQQPSKNYQLKAVASALAEYNKETAASDPVVREDDNVWDKYFPKSSISRLVHLQEYVEVPFRGLGKLVDAVASIDYSLYFLFSGLKFWLRLFFPPPCT